MVSGIHPAKTQIYDGARLRLVRDLRGPMFFSRLLFGTLLLSLAYTVSNVAVPYSVSPGSAAYLDGSANAIDNAGVYAAFPAYSKMIYLVGDAQCHQLSYRSIWLNGNQMPMDARMTSIYTFANFGLIAAMFAAPSTSVAQGLVNAMPRRLQEWGRKHLGPTLFAGLIVFLGIFPVGVDGFTQLLTSYESTNVTRVLTGIPTGFVAGLLVGVIMTSIRQVDLEVSALRSRARVAQ
ncbi:MAG TPA: DUF2085 domain-containing protein [Thermoplasmata archaeon]|jgi:uncharacterized membrane protein|nr:DUF2085 domain-containing protein [Thermoplasmata archaeon]